MARIIGNSWDIVGDNGGKWDDESGWICDIPLYTTFRYAKILSASGYFRVFQGSFRNILSWLTSSKTVTRP